VKERENAEDGVFGADVDYLEHTSGFGLKVAMREHHALGVTGGARGVEDHRNVIGGDRSGLEGAGTGGEDVSEKKYAVDGIVTVDDDQLDVQVLGCFFADRKALAVAEQQHRIGVKQ
jgi:hypothetical protein